MLDTVSPQATCKIVLLAMMREEKGKEGEAGRLGLTAIGSDVVWTLGYQTCGEKTGDLLSQLCVFEREDLIAKGLWCTQRSGT